MCDTSSAFFFVQQYEEQILPTEACLRFQVVSGVAVPGCVPDDHSCEGQCGSAAPFTYCSEPPGRCYCDIHALTEGDGCAGIEECFQVTNLLCDRMPFG